MPSFSARALTTLFRSVDRISWGIPVLRSREIPGRAVDARRCIITNEEYTCAAPLISETFAGCQKELRPLIEDSVVPVMGGFAGKSDSSERGSFIMLVAEYWPEYSNIT